MCDINFHMGHNLRKSDFLHLNNKGADQPEHCRRLISIFAILSQQRMISILALYIIS